jgi:A/G-specific adenine glycosylase
MPLPSSRASLRKKRHGEAGRWSGLPAPPHELAALLVSWYRKQGRRLPWRGTRDPYAIWVSEVMLQQTQAATAIPYYTRFLERFPDLGALAAAPLTQVLAHWSGLGYYARARSLHAAAKEIRARGAFPRTLETLRGLPGFGPYTAAAVGSIAFDLPEPAIDGNAVRVYSRLLAIREPRPAAEQVLRKAVRPLFSEASPSELNQAVMDLGQLVCTPRAPACLLCPWSSACLGRKLGLTEALPVKTQSPARRQLRVLAASIVRRDGHRLMARRREHGLFGGLWELPGGEVKGGASPTDALCDLLRENLGIETAIGDQLGGISQVLTHRDLRLTAYRAVPKGRMTLSPAGLYVEARFFAPEGLEKLGLSSATRKLLQVLG